MRASNQTLLEMSFYLEVLILLRNPLKVGTPLIILLVHSFDFIKSWPLIVQSFCRSILFEVVMRSFLNLLHC
jgi:hypothetical protein